MPTKPRATTPPVTDAHAASEEATDQPISVSFEGETYTVDRARLESIEFLESFQDNNYALMIRALLGPGQWRAFKARHTDVRDLVGFSDAFGTAAGTGNS